MVPNKGARLDAAASDSTAAGPGAESRAAAYQAGLSYAQLHANERDRRNTLQHQQTTKARKQAVDARTCCKCDATKGPWHVYNKGLDEWVRSAGCQV